MCSLDQIRSQLEQRTDRVARSLNRAALVLVAAGAGLALIGSLASLLESAPDESFVAGARFTAIFTNFAFLAIAAWVTGAVYRARMEGLLSRGVLMPARLKAPPAYLFTDMLAMPGVFGRFVEALVAAAVSLRRALPLRVASFEMEINGRTVNPPIAFLYSDEDAGAGPDGEPAVLVDPERPRWRCWLVRVPSSVDHLPETGGAHEPRGFSENETQLPKLPGSDKMETEPAPTPPKHPTFKVSSDGRPRRVVQIAAGMAFLLLMGAVGTLAHEALVPVDLPVGELKAQMKDLEGRRFVLYGEITSTRSSSIVEVQADGKTLSYLRLGDDEEDIGVFYDPSDADSAPGKGDWVRVTGEIRRIDVWNGPLRRKLIVLAATEVEHH